MPVRCSPKGVCRAVPFARQAASADRRLVAYHRLRPFPATAPRSCPPSPQSPSCLPPPCPPPPSPPRPLPTPPPPSCVVPLDHASSTCPRRPGGHRGHRDPSTLLFPPPPRVAAACGAAPSALVLLLALRSGARSGASVCQPSASPAPGRAVSACVAWTLSHGPLLHGPHVDRFACVDRCRMGHGLPSPARACVVRSRPTHAMRSPHPGTGHAHVRSEYTQIYVISRSLG